MAVYRCSIWTGPVGVVRIGRLVRKAGLRTPIIGTERVYVDVAAVDSIGARIKIQDKLRRKYGRVMGLEPNYVRRKQS